MVRKTKLTFFMPFLFLSCGAIGFDKEEKNDEEDQKKVEEQVVFELNHQFDETRESIRSLLSEITSCPEMKDHSLCKETEFEYSDSNFNWPEKQSVLIIDSADSSSLLRYRNRVKARYKISENGEYIKESIKYKLPKGVGKVFYDILGGNTFIPTKELSEFEVELNSKFPKYYKVFNIDHGNPILSILAEYNPESSFVMAKMIEPNYHFCNKDWEKLNSFYQKAAKSLKEKILEHGVHYVNYSQGLDRSLTFKSWKEYCSNQGEFTNEDADKFLKIDQDFVKTLSSIEGVIFVQAGITTLEENSNSEYSPTDCSTDGFKNRIRIGVLNNTQYHFDPMGNKYEEHHELIQKRLKASMNCLDVWMNSGMEHKFPFIAGPSPVEMTSGLGVFKAPLWETSFAAPLALSRVIHLKEVEFSDAPFNNELIQSLINKITLGYKSIHDPVQTKSLEKYRLGY